MTAGTPWLYMLVQVAGTSLVAATYFAGLIIALRRWHLGTGARLASAGFALLVFTLVIGLVFYQVQGIVFDSSNSDTMFLRLAAFGALTSLLSTIGSVFVVLGLRSALTKIARLEAEPHELRSTDLR